MELLIITIKTGEQYAVNSKGQITQFDGANNKLKHPFSGQWLFTGITEGNKPFNSFQFHSMTKEVIENISNQGLTYKNGNPKFVVRDIDHGTRRIWGNRIHRGIFTMHFVTVSTYPVIELYGKKYKVHNGTYFDSNTPDELVELIEMLIQTNTRVVVNMGDVKTGKMWLEEFDTIGYIGRTTGKIKSPILVYNSRSTGGGLLSTENILRVRTTDGKRLMYQHTNFIPAIVEVVPSDMEEYKFNTIVNGELYGRHKTEKSAQKIVELFS
jgi:hypothetical protein